MRDDRTVTFRLKAPDARSVSLAGVAILVALGREQPVSVQKGDDGVWSLTEYYVGGHGGHDWATWRHLLYERFLPGLWRNGLEAASGKKEGN